MQGLLFTRDFLLEGIADTEAWKALSAEEIEIFRKTIIGVFAEFPFNGKPNEAQTEDDLIVPVLKALGWTQYSRQQIATKRREDIPDILLFSDAEAKKRANAEKNEQRKYRHGLMITESKAWGLPLDRGAPDLFNQDAPSSQILRYLTRVEMASERAIQWGILTNGRLWRLYFQGARSRSEEFLGLDLALLADAHGVQPELGAEEVAQRDHLLKAFLLLFRRNSFVPSAEDGRTFHQIALLRTKEWEARVSEDLSRVVFDLIFPQLIEAVVKGDPQVPKTLDAAYLEKARHAALTLLYRLLFVLYAEDRNLLPAHDQGYADYSLRKLRTELQERVDRKVSFSSGATSIWDRLKTIFTLIDKGDPAIGLPPYNGGLFDPLQHVLLARTQLSDTAIGPVLDMLSRRRGRDGETPTRINYRDLSVQHLGSIYERLLEFVVVAKDGSTAVQLNPFARKGSGSYYTHEDLVHLIIEHTIGPLADECQTAFAAKSKALTQAKGTINSRIEELSRLDPAVAILDLKICDPAMGSGHFLVSLVDYLADEILEAMGVQVEWADPRQPYKSPLIARIGAIRQRIRDEARNNRWKVEESHLDDRHLVRRMILKRCVYGVDKNPVAVELAQVALWLHTFTVGAPLSFLDHHLRCGDSLFGEWVRPVEDMLVKRGGMFLNPSVARAKNSAKGMLTVEALTDADIAEVRNSATTFAGVEEATKPLARFMDLVHALRWIKPDNDNEKDAIDGFYDGHFGDQVAIADGSERPKGKVAEILAKLIAKARALVAEQHFLHWEVAFPGVWTDWESKEPTGGFDAVIGNPPWDRMKLQDVEWFATRRPDIAMSIRAADRKKKIAALEKTNDPLWRDYILARERAERAAEIARESGQYPLLSSGDINLYSLFVERAMRIVKHGGLIGLLTPSGIASDKTAAPFFKGVSTTGRLKALYDFENKGDNRPLYFADVHAQAKFCALIASPTPISKTAKCAFFIQDIAELSDPDRCFELSADDFARMNPNTGTTPIFKTRRDAALTSAIYNRIPVLVDRSSGKEKMAWPLRYLRMFDMTNDSSLFRTRQEMEEGEGAYPIDGNRFRNKAGDWLPLYEGKMIWHFDHRAASVIVNIENQYRPAYPDATKLDQHRDPNFVPEPQFWILATDKSKNDKYALAFRDVTNPTDRRTMDACFIPYHYAGNTLPLILDDQNNVLRFSLLCANLNSIVLDYTSRQKVQKNHLNWYIVEQLPIVPPDRYDSVRFGRKSAAEIVREAVLELSYTSHDMAPFAHDMGYIDAKGKVKPPFKWDDARRLMLSAKLDAIYFYLYGITKRDDVRYIYSTFPLIEREETSAHGRYLSCDLCLAWISALTVGNPDAEIKL